RKSLSLNRHLHLAAIEALVAYLHGVSPGSRRNPLHEAIVLRAAPLVRRAFAELVAGDAVAVGIVDVHRQDTGFRRGGGDDNGRLVAFARHDRDDLAGACHLDGARLLRIDRRGASETRERRQADQCKPTPTLHSAYLTGRASGRYPIQLARIA